MRAAVVAPSLSLSVLVGVALALAACAAPAAGLGPASAAAPCDSFTVTGARVRWSRCPRGASVFDVVLDPAATAWVHTSARGVPESAISRLDASGGTLWTAAVPEARSGAHLASDGRGALFAFVGPTTDATDATDATHLVFFDASGHPSPPRVVGAVASVAGASVNAASGLYAVYLRGKRDGARALTPDRLVTLTASGPLRETPLPESGVSFRAALTVHADGSVTALVGLQPGTPAGTLVFVGPDGRLRGSRAVTHATGLGPHPSGSLLLRERCGATGGGLELSVLGADGVERSRRCVEGLPTAKLAVDEAGNSFLVGGSARLALDITALAPDGGLRGVARLDGCASGNEPRLSAARGELLLRCQGEFGRLFLGAIAFDR